MRSVELNALSFTQELRKAFEAYLMSTNAITESEPELRQEVYRQIAEADEGFFREPLVHALPVYEPSFSVAELAVRPVPPRLHPQLGTFQGADSERPLYVHQVHAIRLVEEGHNIVVATGTGSGKTEAFLLPILDRICRDPRPGIRAILVYPMNALANDQLQRLREALKDYPDITFGRYTGETPHTITHRDPLAPPNEQCSRTEMYGSPPNILITNFAMLEYLLIRPMDARLFHPASLRFVVLDEAHTYRGAQSIEIGLLLRRVRQAFAGCSLQFILTSATLGGPSEKGAVAEFAQRLTGLNFGLDDVLLGEPFESFGGSSRSMAGPTLAEVCSVVPNDEALEDWLVALDDPARLAEKIQSTGWNTAAFALSAAPKGTGPMLDAFLRPLGTTARLHGLTTSSAKPLPQLAEDLWGVGGEDATRATTWLLVLAARARPRGSDAPPLIPARFHYVLRGLSGATICLNPECPKHAEHPSTVWSAVFLEDRAHCLHCGSPLFPLATCVHCGQPYVAVAVDHEGKWQQHVQSGDQETTRWFLWSLPDELHGEDDFDASPQSDTHASLWRFCLHDSCRRVLPGEGPATCCSGSLTITLSEEKPDTCPRCHGRRGRLLSVARLFRTTDDAATSVVAETLVRLQAAVDARLPASGRRLLTFSDSRQRAAFFVPYLTRVSAESAIRSDLYAAFQSLVGSETSSKGLFSPLPEDGSVDFERLVRRYTDEGLKRPVQTVRLFDEKTKDDVYEVDDLRSYGPEAQNRLRGTAAVTLLEEACGSPWRQRRMLNAGLAAPEVSVSAEELQAFLTACPELVAAAGADGYDGVQILLGHLLRWYAVTLPEGVSLAELFGDSAPQAVYVALEESDSRGAYRVKRWNPYRSTTSRPQSAITQSGLLNVLERMLGVDRHRDQDLLKNLLDHFWEVARKMVLCANSGPDPHYQLRYQRIVLTKRRPFWRCPVCGSTTVHPYRGRCLLCGTGELRPLRSEDVEPLRSSRYLRDPVALVVREHTAQITPEQGRKYQDQFREGKVNVLSSSTTFELGIDVGQLKVVLLRNVPPTASQYVQRAGRAGRRAEGAAFAVTYARSAPHDQYHYHRPEAFVEGSIRPPKPDMRNRVLAQRHVQSYLLGRFFRQVSPDESCLYAGTFLQPGGLAEEAIDWWQKESSVLAREVAEFLPRECDLSSHGHDAVIAACRELGKVQMEFLKERIGLYEREKDDVLQRMNHRDLPPSERSELNQAIVQIDKLIHECRNTPLLDHLAEAHWLPGYAFPQDVVRLQVRQKQATGVRLERDREYGISEYAPGSEVIADGKVLRSRAVQLGLAGLGEVREYRICRRCGHIVLGPVGADDLVAPCSCGEINAGRSRRFIVPRGFSTLVSDAIGRPNVARELPPPNAEVRQIRGAEESDFAPHPEIPEVVCGRTETGQMFVANPGPRGNGFQLCESCGALVPKKAKVHVAPWGVRCSGATRRLDLAHEFSTHTLDLRFSDKLAVAPPNITDQRFWFSLCTALHVGACECLSIEPTDIGVTSRPYGADRLAQVVIYDRIPGGAGYTGAIYDNLRKVLEATERRLDQCPNPKCDRNGSCYSCLRSNRNQYRWDDLVRGPVADWLAHVIGKAQKEDRDASTRTSGVQV